MKRGGLTLGGPHDGPLVVAARADADPRGAGSPERQPLHCHAHLAGRYVDGIGQTVDADFIGMAPQERGDQLVVRIQRRTVRMASRTVSSGPDERAPRAKWKILPVTSERSKDG